MSPETPPSSNTVQPDQLMTATALNVLRSYPVTTKRGQQFMADNPMNHHQRRCLKALMRKATKKTRKLLRENP